tara:strand:+ start:1838 stop:2044 length:207 start_codon:yes stop_codon:yes gene_type:complete
MDNQNLKNNETMLEKKIITTVLLKDLESKGKEAKDKIKNAACGDKDAEEKMTRELDMLLNHYSWMLTR